MSPFTFVANHIDRFVLPVVSRHALVVLKREYDCTAAHRILWHAWDEFRVIAARIPARRPTQTRIMLSFAAASAALHRAMLHAGAEESRATAVVAEIGTHYDRKFAGIPWWLGRLSMFDSIARQSLAIPLSRWLVSPGPASVRRLACAATVSISLEVHRCPTVELYEDLGIPHLSGPLICDLEFAAEPCLAQPIPQITPSDAVELRTVRRRQPVPPKGSIMKLVGHSCCSGAYGLKAELWRSLPLLTGAVLLLMGGLSVLHTSASPVEVLRQSIVVSAESPHAVVSKPLGPYTLQLSDMRDALSLLLVDSKAAAVPLGRFTTDAQYASRGNTETSAAVEAMNDHLMIRVNPEQAGTLTVSVTADGQRHKIPFELPLGGPRRTP